MEKEAKDRFTIGSPETIEDGGIVYANCRSAEAAAEATSEAFWGHAIPVWCNGSLMSIWFHGMKFIRVAD